MSIYGKFLQLVECGKPFKVDFKKKSMKVGNQFLIKEGEWDLEEDLIVLADDIECKSINEWCLSTINNLYKSYKYSTPSKKSEQYKSYFYALPQTKLSDAELIIGQNREYARAALEGFILCVTLKGFLVWDERTMGKWFWQGEDKDLVILREWIENE